MEGENEMQTASQQQTQYRKKNEHGTAQRLHLCYSRPSLPKIPVYICCASLASQFHQDRHCLHHSFNGSSQAGSSQV